MTSESVRALQDAATELDQAALGVMATAESDDGARRVAGTLETVAERLRERAGGPPEPSRVWVIENGYYEQRHVVAVASSITAAVEYIKSIYGPPYRVEWDEPEGDGEYCELVGRFEAVQWHSTEHTSRFTITAEDLVA